MTIRALRRRAPEVAVYARVTAAHKLRIIRALKANEAIVAMTRPAYAFAVLVFAELLRSCGARGETKPVWRISLFTNVNLVIVVGISFGLQVRSQHSATLGRFLKTSSIPLADCFLLLAAGAMPLLTLEMVKVCGTPGGEASEMNLCARSKTWVNGALKEPHT